MNFQALRIKTKLIDKRCMCHGVNGLAPTLEQNISNGQHHQRQRPATKMMIKNNQKLYQKDGYWKNTSWQQAVKKLHKKFKKVNLKNHLKMNIFF